MNNFRKKAKKKNKILENRLNKHEEKEKMRMELTKHICRHQ